jgi:hypothetical protein
MLAFDRSKHRNASIALGTELQPHGKRFRSSVEIREFQERAQMPERWLGLEVGADEIKLIDAEIPDDATAPIVIQSDQTLPIQHGNRPKAYEVMHRQLVNYARENGIKRAVVKASAAGGGVSMRLPHLHAAEVRGVAICALASVTEVKTIAKSHVSRNFGERKADEYLRDDEFWTEKVTGAALRRGSRPAALVILAARQADA